MPATAASDQAPEVEQPKHPPHALTTYELKDYRRQLERVVEFYGHQTPVPPVRADLQAALDQVIAEQEDRARIARA
jgi:hypothetical protein